MWYSESLVAGTLDERAARCAAKLERVRRERWPLEPEAFGTAKHRFVLKPPLSVEAVVAFETRYGVEVPEAYRTFLTRLGAGGAGPYYGILGLDGADEPGFDEPLERILQAPCMVRPAMADGWTDELPADVLSPFQGMLCIMDQGCTYYGSICLNGPFRGRVVNIDLDGAPPRFSDNPDFLAYYERWLDDWLDGSDLFWFGFGITGDESELLHLVVEGGENERRTDAAFALGRLPSPGPTALNELQRILQVGDEDESLRAAAATTLARRGDTGIVDVLVSTVVAEPSVEVRRAIVSGLWRHHKDVDGRLDDVMVRLLGDDDGDVVKFALYAVRDRKCWTLEMVEPLADDERKDVRSTARWLLGRPLR